jgi:hypothetical protein
MKDQPGSVTCQIGKGPLFTGPDVHRGMHRAQSGIVASVVVAMLVACVTTLPFRIAGAVTPVRLASHPSQSIPTGLARAIHARFGPGPIGLGHAPLVSGIAPTPGGWTAKSQSFSALLTPQGVARVSINGAAPVSLRAVTLRAGTVSSSLRVTSSVLSHGRLVQSLGPVTSLEQVTHAGLEQQFVLARPPSADATTLTLTLASTQSWKVVRGGSAVSVVGTNLAYAGLRTADSAGRVLPSHFVASKSGPEIVIDARGAVYPIAVDPTWTSSSTPTATLLNSAGVGGNQFGVAVAISADDTTALVGADQIQNTSLGGNAGQDAGAAYIFHVSDGATWTTSAIPTATLTDPGQVGFTYFGISVALSANGTTALIGDQVENVNDVDSAYVYTVASETKWATTDKPKAILTDGDKKNNVFGASLALSSNGTTALIGATDGNGDAGVAYIFNVASVAKWATSDKPTASLTDSALKKENYDFGWSVALSTDGTTALIGARFANAAYIYHAGSAKEWATTKKPTSTLTDGTGTDDQFATAVALSADGTTALVGAPSAQVDGSGNIGAAYVFHSSSEKAWPPTPKPVATLSNSATSDDSFGNAVALSSDGTTALIGDAGVEDSTGAAYIFHTSSEKAWSSSSTPKASLTNGNDEVNDGLGSSLILSADGTTALLDAFGDGNSDIPGSAYIFHSSSESVWSSSSSPVATLTDAANGLGDDGYAVALSADGTTALVGYSYPYNNTAENYVDTVSVFHTTSEGAWSSNSVSVATLTNGVPSDYTYGDSLALSADGTTAFIGDTNINDDSGAVYVYHVSSEEAWSSASTSISTATATLSVASETGDWFGWGISVSEDGTTAIVGNGEFASDSDSCDDSAVGAVYVFHVSSESAWKNATSPTATITDPGDTASDCFGAAVTLSADGTTALIGAFGADEAYIFRASSESVWRNTSSPKATLTDSAADWFGWSVSLSSDGTTALIGAPATYWDDDGDYVAYTGAAYIFYVSSEGAWSSSSAPEATLSDPANSYYTVFGWSVALSSAGTTALISGDGAGSTGGPGAVYVFSASSESVWSSSSTPTVTLSDSALDADGECFGWSLALSQDGTTAVIGAYGANSAFIYQQ